jgi:hypothetical protein
LNSPRCWRRSVVIASFSSRAPDPHLFGGPNFGEHYIYKDGPSKTQALAILSKYFNLYGRDSSELIDSYRREEPDSQVSNAFRQLFYDLKGPFDRGYHYYYDITKSSIVDAINSLDYKHEVARKFRDVRDKAIGIFQMRSSEADIYFDPDDMLEKGVGVVCVGNELYGRYVLIVNPDNQKRIRIISTNTQTICPGERNTSSLIKISHWDGNDLFCKIDLIGKKRVIMYSAPIGYMFSSSTSGERAPDSDCGSMG